MLNSASVHAWGRVWGAHRGCEFVREVAVHRGGEFVREVAVNHHPNLWWTMH